MPKLEVVNANNVIEFNPQKANFKLKNTGGPKGETGAQGPKGDTGPQGLQGPAGASASVTVGSTTTLSPGADATVTNSGDTRNAILNFGIPTGARGPKGDTGSKGDTGPMGPKGAKGDTGAAATVQVGNTNTGAPGTNAQVTNAGNEHFAVFNFTIPRGDKGEKGATGATGPQGPAGQDGTDGFSPIATVTQEGLDAEISITDKDGTTTATVPGFGVQVVESLPATGSSNVIYLERDSNTATGNPISIADAVEAPLKSLEIQGETSQNGTPTPDAPVAVQTVTGENTLTISDGTNTQSYEVNLGKNLFDKDNANVAHKYPVAAGNGLSSNASAYSIFLPAEEGTTYTVSSNSSSLDASASIFFTSESPTTATTWISREMRTGGATSITATAPSGARYVGVYLIWSTNATTISNLIATVQLELGSAPTSYAAYFEPIELCKIGDYQDYIYPSGEKWYVHKETGKVDLSSLTWVETTDVIRGSTGVTGIKYAPDNHTIVPAYAECYRIRQGSGLSNFRNYLAIDTSKINVNTGSRTINPTGIFYYPLATPTDTEITNQALIAQLEAILAGGTQAGANTITLTPSAGATGTLEVEYYDSYDSYLWVNNRWEKFAHLG